jgi:MYXO-CTERM domain-containing protein
MSVRVLALAALLAASGAAMGSGDVLILGANDQTWMDEVKSTIGGTGLIGGNIDTYSLFNGAPSLQMLQQYCSVLVMTDAGPPDPGALGDVLADFVDGGGGVVVSTFALDFGIDGRFRSQNYLPMDAQGQLQGSPQTLGTIYDASHPILNGVGSFNGGTSSYRNANGPVNGTVVADWSDGTHLIIDNQNFAGGIVGLNFYPPSSLSRSDFWDINTDGDVMMANALNYVCRVPAPGAAGLLGLGGLAALRRRR